MVPLQHDWVSHVFQQYPGVFKVAMSSDHAFVIWFGDQLLLELLQVYVEFVVNAIFLYSQLNTMIYTEEKILLFRTSSERSGC